MGNTVDYHEQMELEEREAVSGAAVANSGIAADSAASEIAADNNASDVAVDNA